MTDETGEPVFLGDFAFQYSYREVNRRGGKYLFHRNFSSLKLNRASPFVRGEFSTPRRAERAASEFIGRIRSAALFPCVRYGCQERYYTRQTRRFHRISVYTSARRTRRLIGPGRQLACDFLLWDQLVHAVTNVKLLCFDSSGVYFAPERSLHNLATRESGPPFYAIGAAARVNLPSPFAIYLYAIVALTSRHRVLDSLWNIETEEEKVAIRELESLD